MIKKPDWLSKNPAFNGGVSKVKFLENMLREFKDAEQVINDKLKTEKNAESSDDKKEESPSDKTEFKYSTNNGKISNMDVHKSSDPEPKEKDQGKADLAEMELKLNSLKKEHEEQEQSLKNKLMQEEKVRLVEYKQTMENSTRLE